MPGYGRHFSPSRYEPRGHSRTKRGWFCLVPSRLDPRLARCSATAGHCVAPVDQPRPSNVILGSTRRWARPASVATQYLRAHCPPTSCQRRWLPKVELGWRTYVTASNVDYAQQCRNAASALPTTVLQAQPTLVAPRHSDTAHRHNAQGGHWARKAKLRRCRHEATPTVHRESQCPKGASTSITTVLQAQPIIVAPRHLADLRLHNARSWQWAHKARLRRCQHETTPTVRRARRGPNKETTTHKTGFAPHTLPLRARGADAARPQSPTLSRQQAQRHSRTKSASYARCNPGRFPGQAVLNYHCPGLATTTVGPRRPRQTNVAQRQRTTPATRSTTLAQHGIWTLCSPVRTLHSLVVPKTWPGTPWHSAAAARRRPRPATALPIISTTVVTPPQNCARQAVDSVSPRPQPCLPQGAAAVVPPRRNEVLCLASRTGNRYPVPAIRCIPETLTKAPRRDVCRAAPAVCGMPCTRHTARTALAECWRPATAQSTTARLTPLHTGEAAR